LGSWAGKTYEEMYPANPQYIEKSVGYKLWQKLSMALGEKVGKKRIRGAVMRHYIDSLQATAITDIGSLKSARCVIIHPSDEPSNHQAMVQTLSQCLQELGCQVHCSSDAEGSLVEKFPSDVDYVIRVSSVD
jgi:RNase P protein component